MGTQLPLPQRGTASHFSAHIRCGQMAVQIKMPLGMEVGLSPGDFLLDGDMDSERDGCHGTQAVIFVYTFSKRLQGSFKRLQN